MRITRTTKKSRDLAAARNAARKWARILGAGFHPDTLPREYVDAHGERVLTPEQCRAYLSDMRDLFRASEHGVDPYAIVLEFFPAQ